MLRISKLTDYAVVLTTHLAAAGGGTRRAVPALAAATAIPEPTVSKVLKALGRAGVVDSIRGANGGYRLARPPSDISVAQVIIALEGPIAVTECVDGASGCTHEEHCGVRANWEHINAALATALEAISLAEMARPDAPRLFQIRSQRTTALSAS